MRRSVRAAQAAAVAALAVLAVGCGSDSDAGGNGNGVIDQVINIKWGAEPPALDPGLATDTTSGDVISNIMDPLVKLDKDLQPTPSLAKSWTVSKDGKTVTFELRDDGRWTNGDPVTAQDFEWSWKRTISPDLGADYAYQFFGIVGAAEYNACEKNCDAMRDKVGVKALDDHTLQVKLTSQQPWFVQQVAHHSFLAVHRATVEKFGRKWTEPQNIVTDGPFKLAPRDHGAPLDLANWRRPRRA